MPAPNEPGEPPAAVKIKIVDSGPLQVKGPIELLDHDGRPYPTNGRRTLFLCRCGHSATRPFCDGSHARVGFESTERAAEQPDA
ncbi:CDGSH iron-sulfur domain-containing protein [Nocardioides deserti]|uniref:CDGSH iron-sulfur domain-containing protein n=1 Tax=Nocardioides deserti TaxID=1588644 RepID=A0ABR6U4R4_9ACTN|nr:CDGSH iron-sulfur domain-containing protein [Nocardioides deserti]MBC2959375.1 CDGSH iron-sulfur domain-containing protein [Nocardioides deserti]GGO73312.1 hypothetical protein GCM10012276_18590 [Nocardioides deserti]